MNIPVLPKNAEGLEGLVKKQHRKKTGKLEFSRRLLQHNWMRLFYEVRQTKIIIYEYSCVVPAQKKLIPLWIAAVRGEVDNLPARCISLLQEVKDLIKAYNSGQENADETAAFTLSERQARPSCTVQQHQGNATH